VDNRPQPAQVVDLSSLQSAESTLLAGLSAVTDALSQIDWLVECAPVTSPSPRLVTPAVRERMLFDAKGVTWPFVAAFDALPIDDDTLPAVLIRHAWQPAMAAMSLAEWVRVLKPGGSLIALSANPWHPLVWRLLGCEAFRWPSWPHFVWAHSHPELKLKLNPFHRGARRWPGLSPVLVLVAQKQRRAAPVRPFKRRAVAVQPARALLTQCRAA